MRLFKQLSSRNLIEFCRALRHNLEAGIGIKRIFQQQAERGPIPVRPVAGRISELIEEGQSLELALKKEKDYFPPIFVSLAIVGEQTGNLPEVLTELEKYLILQQRLFRQFISQIAWPAIQLLAAPFVIAAMLFVLSMISGNQFHPLGSITAGEFLLDFFGTIALLVIGYLLLKRLLKDRATVEQWLLRVWVIGPCLYAIAMTRFCMALRLTMESGMSIAKALRLSMHATGNQAFIVAADEVVESVRSGSDLEAALRSTGLFTDDFLDILANAEEGGRVAEVMAHQGDYYEEEARRRMTILTRAASWGFYAAVAAFLIFMIFSIFTNYLLLIDPKTHGL
jgi:type IV pilus assembly protein PilC